MCQRLEGVGVGGKFRGRKDVQGVRCVILGLADASTFPCGPAKIHEAALHQNPSQPAKPNHLGHGQPSRSIASLIQEPSSIATRQRSGKQSQTTATQLHSPDQLRGHNASPGLFEAFIVLQPRALGWMTSASRLQFFQVCSISSTASLVQPLKNPKKSCCISVKAVVYLAGR